MSNYDAIAEVGKSLKNLIWENISIDPNFKDISSSDIILSHPDSNDVGKLCIFLYRIEEDSYEKNYPMEKVGSNQLNDVPISLNLFYMITPRYDKTNADYIQKSQILLGKIIQIFYNNPVLRSPVLTPPLQNEEIKLRFMSPSIDEINKIWSMPESNLYMISAYYEVSTVRLDSSQSTPVTRVSKLYSQLEYKGG